MKFIGNGKTRNVYDGGDHVVKIIIGRKTVDHNKKEMKVWQKKPEWRKWLCEPYELFFDGLVMTMEKGEPLKAGEKAKGYPDAFLNTDNKSRNWVKVNGQYKRCDYSQLADKI